ncbi:hypothetical protein [Halobacteriovorax sp. JY17]|uniref:hypothetical protein n=1 Tax=Halobacteriovorax sp. JY17 TaxID=2014617 RepID=UPI000C4E6B8F|nr:hypothetical protein [Halobacteriovorax sp. JY17]PIK15282.1 MAG: hypothetical protein CES88_00805 [Halobacteriovorax sp. JY17]
MSQIKSQILSRIEKHTHSKSIQLDFDYLMELQREQAPTLRSDLVEVCVIESFVKLYEDKTLDYLLYEYMDQQSTRRTERTAA